MTKPRILYVDFAPSAGGSVRSLIQILDSLPHDRYEPYALLSPSVSELPEIAALDIPIMVYDAGQGMAIPFRSGTQQVRSNQPASWLRDQRWLGTPWRWGSITRRIWLRSRHTAAFIASVINDNAIDLIHMNDAIPLAEPGILAARWCKKPSLVTVRSFGTLDHLHHRLCGWIDAVVFTSKPLREEQLAQGVQFRRERIIPNAIDLRQFELVADRAGVRAELGLAEDVPLVTVVGRIMQRKGLDIFIRAMVDVVARHADAHGLIVGDVEITDVGLDSELRRLAEDLGICDHIHFSGYRSDVPRLLLASDLLCFVPTVAEPFGRTLIEGMAAGLPAVGANSGAIPDILADGETGLLVPPADPYAQAVAIDTLLADPERARAMGNAGRCRVAERYSIEHQVDKLSDLYDEILG